MSCVLENKYKPVFETWIRTNVKKKFNYSLCVDFNIFLDRLSKYYILNKFNLEKLDYYPITSFLSFNLVFKIPATNLSDLELSLKEPLIISHSSLTSI